MIKKHIPNAITCSNLLAGCLGIVYVFEGSLTLAAYCIFIGAILDFLDGMFARLLKVSSNIGKDLDSLADVVSFGVLPALIIFQLLKQVSLDTTIPYFALGLAVFSALRLAKFNNDPRQSENFIGVPTPANAIIVATFPLLLNSTSSLKLQDIIYNEYFLIGYIILMSYLLVSEIYLFSLKFKTFSIKGNEYQWALLVGTLSLGLLFHFGSALFILLLYIVLSFIKFKNIKK